MSWVRLDDSMPEDDRIERLSDGAFRAYVTAICRSARLLTDGKLSTQAVQALTGKRNKQLLAELVPGIWHEPSVYCPSPFCQGIATLEKGEYLIHNFLKYNPTKEKVLAEREAAKRRMNGGRGGDGS